MNLLGILRTRFEPALAELTDDVAPLLDMIRPTKDAKNGDYQANCAMPLKGKLNKPPRDIAADIIAKLQIDDICEPPEIGGPGFINLRFKTEWLAKQLQSIVNDDRLGVGTVAEPKTYVIDYSSPNVAKPMHVGHVRSTVIGDALARILRFMGHKVISDNHVGDWGTQFGMIIYGYRNFLDQAAYDASPVTELARLYQLVYAIIKHQQSPQDEATEEVKQLSPDHPEIQKKALAETAKLHEGDEENNRLWSEILPHCRVEIQRTYDRLDVQFDYEYGESFYHDMLGDVVDELIEKEIATESDGAICVFFPGKEAPMIVRKSGGAFLYATTDLATIKYRMEEWKPDAILYVVDHRQSEHFQNLFATAKRWGFDEVELQHVRFGTVLGEDGKPMKAREGDAAGLEGLLDRAVEGALEIVQETSPQLPAETQAKVADIVGHGAIRYADMSHARTSDYKFSYPKMLALKGNTSAYMQIAHARVYGIFSKGDIDIAALRAAAPSIQLDHPAERALGIELLRFENAIDDVLLDYRPNMLTDYLYEQLAKAYSGFFENCHVLKAENEATKESRLLLCDLTARTIKQGLNLLGIGAPERM